MGQYFLIVNLDKKEFIHPSRAGMGSKLWEIAVNNGGIFPLLLRKSSEGGGGDIMKPFWSAGRWAGNRVVVVGDYDKSGLYDKAQKRFKDVTKRVVKDFNEFIEDPDKKLEYHDWSKDKGLQKMKKEYLRQKKLGKVI